MISTGGGRGHAPGCRCPFCLSGTTLAEASLGVDLVSEPDVGSHDDSYQDALDEYHELYAQAHADGYVRPSDPGEGRGEAWTAELNEVRHRAERSFGDAVTAGEYGDEVEAAQSELDSIEDEYFSRPQDRDRRKRTLTKELRAAHREAGVTDPRDAIRAIEETLREAKAPTAPAYDAAVAEYGIRSAVFRDWADVPADYRSETGGERKVLAMSREHGTVLVPHLGPEALDEWYGDQIVFGPDRPAAAAKAITAHAAAKEAREASPWDESKLRDLNHTKRLREAYSEYGDNFRG